MVQNSISKYLEIHSGNIKMQPYFSKLLLLTLNCLNYGKIEDFKISGELNTMRYIKSKLKNENNLIIFDVGANIGKYTQALTKVFNKDSVIYSFEPSMDTYKKLCANIIEHKNILTYNIGMSNKTGERVLYYDKQNSGLASLYDRNIEHYNLKLGIKEKVKIETIDSFCCSHDIERIHFLKLDVEGHELEVLKGANGLISNQLIQYIQFEFGGCNIDSRTYFRDFFYYLKDNYIIYRIIKNGLSEIKTYNEINEIFMTINYLAELKQNSNSE
jgi:FkbM family methyltransferase